MKKILILLAAASTVFFTACSSSRSMIPSASNTMNPVNLSELNLTSSDYEIMGTVEANSVVVVEIGTTYFKITDPEGKFTVSFKKDKNGNLELNYYEGVLRAGYLSNDYGTVNCSNPDDVARRIAIYRLIGIAKAQGADGIVEPVISTNIEQTDSGWNSTTVTYRTSVVGKAFRLK